MEQILKYVWIVNTLHNAGERGLTLKELSQKWQRNEDLSGGEALPRQTLFRWRDELVRLFGVIIDCNKTGGYRYYIANPQVLNAGELTQWLMDTFTTARTLTRHMALMKRILVAEIPSSHHYLDRIFDAMQEGRQLRITHRSFAKQQAYTFLVEPYCTKMFLRRWYLVARRVTDGQLRIYGLDRIENLSLEEARFQMPESFDAEQYFASYFGVVLDESIPVQRIRIRANKYHKHYLRTLPLHPSQRELCDTDGGAAEFELTLRPTYDFIMELLRSGRMIEVLEPLSLRQVMRDWVRDMWELYQEKD